MRTLLTIIGVAVACAMAGCKSAPAPVAAPLQPASAQYPVRPSIAPPSFKVFHHDASSITLVTKDNATDAEIEALIWQLHDATLAHSFDSLKIDQKWIDARDPMMWFHIYRGTKCASEKYVATPPCGGSYHAAGDYTLGGFTNRDRDDGVLFEGEDRQIQLWNPDAPRNDTKQGATK